MNKKIIVISIVSLKELLFDLKCNPSYPPTPYRVFSISTCCVSALIMSMDPVRGLGLWVRVMTSLAKLSRKLMNIQLLSSYIINEMLDITTSIYTSDGWFCIWLVWSRPFRRHLCPSSSNPIPLLSPHTYFVKLISWNTHLVPIWQITDEQRKY